MRSSDLIEWFRPVPACVVAFSGGLDSSVVAKAAALALGDKAVAVIASSPTSLQHEVNDARSVAEAIQIRFVAFSSTEMDDPRYVANDRERCYYCKQIRFGAIRRFATEQRIETVVDGSNADDLNDFRPGRRAQQELEIRSPLAELGITKPQVRELARLWELPNSEKPATPCLGTRLSYGLKITEERLRRVETGEEFLREFGFFPNRVRIHSDDLVRIEIPAGEIAKLVEPLNRIRIIAHFRKLGFRYVCIELQGFQSGSMNDEST